MQTSGWLLFWKTLNQPVGRSNMNFGLGKGKKVSGTPDAYSSFYDSVIPEMFDVYSCLTYKCQSCGNEFPLTTVTAQKFSPGFEELNEWNLDILQLWTLRSSCTRPLCQSISNIGRRG